MVSANEVASAKVLYVRELNLRRLVYKIIYHDLDVPYIRIGTKQAQQDYCKSIKHSGVVFYK